MVVFVFNKHGRALMPCSPRIARKLLKDKCATVLKLEPFTIKLLYGTTGYTQQCVLGIDKGSSYTGASVVSEQKVLISAKVNHRVDVHGKITDRAALRRARRSRLWYRACRFKNRAASKREDRLAPTISTNIEEVLRVVNKLPVPIHKVIIEDVLVDIARLNDSTLKGTDYQKPKRLNENLRLATLMRDGFKCKHCSAKDTKLEAHHILPRSQNGKDTISNLITLCSKCHEKLHAGKIKLDTSGVDKHFDVIAQHTMQGKTRLYKSLFNKFNNLDKMFGYETATLRNELHLPKDHDVDAFVLCKTINLSAGYNRDNYYEVNLRPKQTRRMYKTLPEKGLGRVKYQVNDELDGFKKGDIVLVKGYRKQINSIYSNGRVAFKRVKGETTSALPRDCRLLEKCGTIMWTKV